MLLFCAGAFFAWAIAGFVLVWLAGGLQAALEDEEPPHVPEPW